MNISTTVDILLIEDNPLDAELITRALRKQNIINPIIILDDGTEALDLLFCRGIYSNRSVLSLPKVILLDLKLPKTSGLEILKEIRSKDSTHFIPVVIVTSSREDPDIEKAYELGANSYVIKPISSDAFIDTMSKLGLYWLLVNQSPKG